MSRPLLAVDGDSLAHRAYHALPKSIRGARRPTGERARRLHEHARRPLGGGAAAGASSSAGTRSRCPTYRHEAFAGYQAGRDFDAELLEQLATCCRSSSRRSGSRRRRRRATRRTTSSRPRPAAEEARGGTALVVTSDRDAFQLASDRTTILHAGPRRQRARPRRAGRGARALRRRARAGAGLHRAARRPVGQAPRRAAASGRRRPPTCCASTARSRRRWRPDGSRRRRRNFASTAE